MPPFYDGPILRSAFNIDWNGESFKEFRRLFYAFPESPRRSPLHERIERDPFPRAPAGFRRREGEIAFSSFPDFPPCHRSLFRRSRSGRTGEGFSGNDPGEDPFPGGNGPQGTGGRRYGGDTGPSRGAPERNVPGMRPGPEPGVVRPRRGHRRLLRKAGPLGGGPECGPHPPGPAPIGPDGTGALSEGLRIFASHGGRKPGGPGAGDEPFHEGLHRGSDRRQPPGRSKGLRIRGSRRILSLLSLQP